MSAWVWGCGIVAIWSFTSLQMPSACVTKSPPLSVLDESLPPPHPARRPSAKITPTHMTTPAFRLLLKICTPFPALRVADAEWFPHHGMGWGRTAECGCVPASLSADGWRFDKAHRGRGNRPDRNPLGRAPRAPCPPGRHAAGPGSRGVMADPPRDLPELAGGGRHRDLGRLDRRRT